MTEESITTNKTVPKFASFRPKPDPPVLNPLGGDSNLLISTKDGLADTTVVLEPSSKRGHRKHRRDEHGSSYWRHEQNEGRYGKGTKPSIALGSWDEPEIYVVDVSGDTANLKYGSLHSYSIPSFFRSGYGSILGLSSSLKIDRQLSNEKYLVIANPDKSQYLKRDKAAFAKVGRGRETKIKPITPAAKSYENPGADFIPIDGGRSKKRQRINHVTRSSGSNTEDEQHHYRSIEGKAKPLADAQDSDIEFNEDASDLGRTTLSTDEVILRKAELSRIVDLDPCNGDAWLNLIDYQEQILLSRSLGQRANAAESMSTADIKLSMYEKALNIINDPNYIERLTIGMMQEGAKLWDVKKLAKKWQNVLQANPTYINLWIKFLDFQQTSSASFHFDDLREAYRKCLDILRQALVQVDRDVGRQKNLIIIQIYLLLRMTICLREAGYCEQSVAIWQVIFEFNLHRSPSSEREMTDTVVSEKLRESFEDFWESEVPRIGEDGSVGWASYISHGGSPPEPKRDENMITGSQTSLIDNWPKLEVAGNVQSQQPARTFDDTGEDDPYRVVLFSDVKEFVLDLPASGNQILLSAFLAYCHLPPLENTPDTLKSWWQDPFIRNDSLSGSEKSLHSSDPLGITTERSTTDLFDLRLSSYAVSVDSLFANHKSWFSAFYFQNPKYKTESKSLDYAWIRRVLRTLVDLGIGGDDLAEYFLAFEYSMMPSTAKKTAKALLKKQPSNLRLYNSYALIEFRAGHRGTAESVLEAAINLSRTLEDNAQKETILLWRTWIWQLMDIAGTEDAVKRMLTIPAIEVDLEVSNVLVNAAACLRTQKILADGRAQALSLGEYRYAVLYSECLILLEYLTNESHIDASLLSYEHHFQLFTSRLPPNSFPHELLHQSRAKLLYYHITHTCSFKPALIRSLLEDSVKRFPLNTIFLSLYAWNEVRFRIDDRVRALVHDVVLSSHTSTNSSTQDIISRFFAVYVELRRSLTTGSNIHSIRGVFERAVESSCGRQSAAMWKLYFLFECEKGGLQRASAVFYRAVRACPWVKELYLLAFERLGKEMSIAELKSVYEMVVERELRVFVSLEEAFEEVEARG